MATWHYMLGLSVFALVWLRLAVRLISPHPAIEPTPPAWQNASAHVVHVALYALMIGMPVLGWLTLSAKGKPVPFFGLAFPALISANKDTAKQLKDIHAMFGTVGYVLIAFHTVAALLHHYVKHDNALQLMLPHRWPVRARLSWPLLYTSAPPRRVGRTRDAEAGPRGPSGSRGSPGGWGTRT
jgi:cytochrome b561